MSGMAKGGRSQVHHQRGGVREILEFMHVVLYQLVHSY